MVGYTSRVGLKTNTTKTEAMTFVPGRVRTPLLEDAYQARMSNHHREEKKGRKVNCHICRKELAVGSLAGHLASQYDTYQCFLSPGAAKGAPKRGQRYEALFYPEEGTFWCPVPGCPQGLEGKGCRTSFNLRWHFVYCHPADKVAVWSKCLPPKCHSCGLQVWTAGTPKHLASKTCKDMTE